MKDVESKTSLEQDTAAVERAFKWMRIYEETNKVVGEDVIGPAEEAFKRIHELAWIYDDMRNS